MRKKLSDNFEIKEFHNMILQNGSLPLILLERVVKDYVDKLKAQSEPDKKYSPRDK